MSNEENKAPARGEIEEIWTRRNLDAAEELCAPNYISATNPAGSEEIRALVGIKRFQF